MKRRREMEKGSEIRFAVEELSVAVVKAKPGGGGGGGGGGGDDRDFAHIPTRTFLSVCNLVLQLLDKIGPTMAVLRQDMDENIKRLEKLHESEPSLYSDMVEILKKEATEGNARKVNSCSRAFLWLTRSLDFTVAFLQLLMKDFRRSIEQVVEEAYNITLKPWHGWISSAAFKVALKLVPDNRALINILMAKDEDHDMLKEDLQAFISLLVPLLEQNHAVLRSYGLDRLKSQ